MPREAARHRNNHTMRRGASQYIKYESGGGIGCGDARRGRAAAPRPEGPSNTTAAAPRRCHGAQGASTGGCSPCSKIGPRRFSARGSAPAAQESARRLHSPPAPGLPVVSGRRRPDNSTPGVERKAGVWQPSRHDQSRRRPLSQVSAAGSSRPGSRRGCARLAATGRAARAVTRGDF